MAKEVFVNIKDLPEITDLAAGQFIIVETPTGTQIIDFENFILPPANTTITTSVSQQADSIALLNTKYDTLSSTVDTNTVTLSNTIVTNYNTLSTEINTLSGKINLLNPLYIGQCKITIPATNTSGSNQITPIPSSVTLSLDDFMIFPANSYAASNPAYPLAYDSSTKILTIKGNFKTKSLTFNESNSYSITSSTTLEELSTYSISSVLGTLQYTEVDGTATESAIYNVIVIKKL